MKKLLLIALFILANTSYSQFSNKGCGWEFRSKSNVNVNLNTEEKTWRYGNIELHYNETCEKSLRICYVNKVNEYYNSVSERYVGTNITIDGNVYYLYEFREQINRESITLQIIYSNPPVIRIHYQNNYIEFHE